MAASSWADRTVNTPVDMFIRGGHRLPASIIADILKSAALDSQWSVECQIAIGRHLLANPHDCSPPLAEMEIPSFRFALADALALAGLEDDADQEYLVASGVATQFNGGAEVMVSQIRFLKNAGRLEEASALVHSPECSSAIRNYSAMQDRISPAIRLLAMRMWLDGLLSQDSLLPALTAMPPELSDRSPRDLAFHDRQYLELTGCELLLFHSDDSRDEAIRRIDALLQNLTKEMLALSGEQQASHFEIIIGLLECYASALAHFGCPKQIGGDAVRRAANWCAHHYGTFDGLSPEHRTAIGGFPWLRLEFEAATKLICALAFPSEARKEMSDHTYSFGTDLKWLERLWPYRRLRVLYQWIMACDIGSANIAPHVELFVSTVAEWRSKAGSFTHRSGLRRSLAWMCSDVLAVQWRWACERAGGDARAPALLQLAEAEDVLGPGRWLQERVAVKARKDGARAPLVSQASAWGRAFPEGGTIIQFLVSRDDLRLMKTQISPDGRPHRLHPLHLPGGTRALHELHGRYLASKTGIMQGIREQIRVAPDGRWQEHVLELDRATSEFSCKLADVVGDTILSLLPSDRQDLLLVCHDPRILGLPWSIMPSSDKWLIDRVNSLTFNISVGAAASMARGTGDRNDGGLELAAFCHDTDPEGKNALRWHRMFEPGNCADLGAIPGLTLQPTHVPRPDRRGEPVNPEMLNAYLASDPRRHVLLVGGHGDPADGRGIWLDQGWWNPGDLIGEASRLNHVECVALPSCRLGEMRSTDADNHDPITSEIIGFAAGFCVSGIPRVLACPWVMYDLPICHLLPEILRRAVEKRAAGKPHYWARAVRDTVLHCLGVQNREKFGLYDIANLMLFGTP